MTSDPSFIWLASYPKTGNTWIRRFLLQALDQAGDDAEAFPQLKKHFPLDAPLHDVMGGRHAIIKTHRRGGHKRVAASPDTAAGLITVVRHPLDAMLSHLNYYGHRGRKDAFLGGEVKSVEEIIEDGEIDHYIDQWIEHDGTPDYLQAGPYSRFVDEWNAHHDLPALNLRYEEMVADPEAQFARLMDFLSLPKDNLDALLEATDKATRANGRFFWKRTAYNFLDMLDEGTIRRFEERYAEPLARLGYAPTQGRGAKKVEPIRNESEAQGGAEIILHVGMQKTGTSAIQRSFAGYCTQDARFADLGPSPNHTRAILAIFADQKLLNYDRARGRSGKAFKGLEGDQLLLSLEQQLHEVGSGKLIISGEGLFQRLDKRTLRRIKVWAKGHGASVTIVAYFRPPVAAASGALSQRVKNYPVTELPVSTPPYAQAEKFVTVFGKANVRFHLYTRDRLKDGDAVADFADRIGVTKPKTKLFNESASLAMLAFLYGMNRELGDLDRAHVRLAKKVVLRNIKFDDERKAILSPDIVLPEMEEKDRLWALENLGADFLDESALSPTIASEADLLAADPRWNEQLDKLIKRTNIHADAKEVLKRLRKDRL